VSRFITIHSILAPVNPAKLERADSLRILGDLTCELSADGTSLRPIDEEGNLMGAIAVLWHDAPEMKSEEIDSFLAEFSPHPREVRKEVVEDPYWTAQGDCGRYFQNEEGHFYFYQGYLLVSPDAEAIEEFFSEGREMLVV
jgi:hypothetical protein